VTAAEAAGHLAAHAAARPSAWFHIDEGAEAAFAGTDVTILVTLLVVASVLQLGNPQDGARFSIEAARAWGHSVALLRVVGLLAYASAAGAGLSLISMIVTTTVVGWIALAVTLATVFTFTVICVLCIRWFWNRAGGR
jgi:hypothetical protein